MHRSTSTIAAALALSLVLGGSSVGATEIVAAHLVFEKSVKMKKLDVAVYVSFVDGTNGLACGVLVRGKSGPLATTGSFQLRLVGELADGSEAWESRSLTAGVDDIGDGSFSGEEIDELVADADAAGVEVAFYRVDYEGGRGGRVGELTVDCLRQESAT